jgi:uncharacterized repeat protein (TIGR03803 family)
VNRNTNLKNWSWLQLNERRAIRTAMLLLLLLCLAAADGTAQIYSVLHDFHWTSKGSDGSSPQGGLAVSGETVYGTTWNGGSNNWGTVFKFNADGSGYTVLKHLTSGNGAVGTPVVPSGQTLYGTSYQSVYKLNTDGSGFTSLRAFDNGDFPGPLLLSGTNLYGATQAGGSSNLGRVFRINTDGTDYTVLKNFTGSDGANPLGGLVLSDNTLYGTTYAGGVSNAGVIFQINTDGSGFAVTKHFTVSDGAGPRAGMLLSGTELYGTTSWGGRGIYVTLGGTVFKINTDGSGFTVLKDFSVKSPGSDGDDPRGSLVLSGTTLYGTTTSGGLYSVGRGTLFKLNTDGTGYAVLTCLTDSSGVGPEGSLVLINGELYGTAQFVGGYSNGVLFALSLTPPAVLPECQTTEMGSMARFEADAPPFWSAQYQWFLNGTNAVSSLTTSPSLRLTNIASSQAGLYTAVITQAAGALTSSPAMLSVIPQVERRPVPGIKVTGEVGSLLNVDYANSLSATPNWLPLDTVTLVSTSQYCFDVSEPLPPQRYYRAWQTGTPGVIPSLSLPGMVPAITLTGNIGVSVRLDYINQFGPIDAWVTLDTVTLTNTSQLYFDVSAPGQPNRLYRLRSP